MPFIDRLASLSLALLLTAPIAMAEELNVAKSTGVRLLAFPSRISLSSPP